MAKVLIIQEIRDKKQDHKWSSSLEIILMIQVAPILWNKQAQSISNQTSLIRDPQCILYLSLWMNMAMVLQFELS